jgi:hypothetical protein
MGLFLPREFETTVIGRNREILISQVDEDGFEAIVVLTIHQFQEIFNREKSIIANAMAAIEDDEA